MAVTKDKALEAIENEDTDIEVGAKDTEQAEEEVQKFNGTVFDALLAAAGYEEDNEERYRIRIVRKRGGVDTEYFSFFIHPLSEEKINIIRKRNTKVKRDRRYGIDREKVDNVRMRSQLIYEATADEDREVLWNDREAWKKLGVLNGIDLIDKVLLAGEKDRIIESIETISGYGSDEELETLVKN